MPKEQLHNRIQELLDEIEQLEAIDAAARDRLADVLQEIRAAVEENSEEPDEEGDSLTDRLKEATRDFEESHPTLTAMVGRIAESLSNLGI